MCLDTVHKKTQKGTGHGYKIVDIKGGVVVNGLVLGAVQQPLSHDRWCKDHSEGRLSFGTAYPLGYHIFTTFEDALEWGGGKQWLPWLNNDSYSIVPVDYEEVVASGRQGVKVIVARQIRLSEVP